MGQKDIAEKILEDYNDVFADIVNGLLFHGKVTVRENELENICTKSQYKADTSKLHEQERDVAKFWEKGKTCFALFGLENQTAVDRDMPLRILSYDGASYRSQIAKKKDGIRYPVITLVLYYGNSPWTGPKSLRDCLEIPEELQEYVNDYNIHVVDIPFLTENQVSNFRSDFQVIADYFSQLQRTGEYVPSRKELVHSDAVLKFFDVFTGDNRFLAAAVSAREDGKEVKNMCDVLDRVENKGRAAGELKGRLEKGIQVYLNMISRGFSPSDAQSIADLTDEEVAQAKSQVKQS